MVAERVGEARPFIQSRAPAVGRVERPDPEVQERVTRRSFTVNYKLRILAEAARCTERGQLGALLRREGLYSSLLAAWRDQQASGGRAALSQARGRKPAEQSTSERDRLQKENARLSRRLAIAEEIIAVQKKVSALLGLTLAETSLL